MAKIIVEIKNTPGIIAFKISSLFGFFDILLKKEETNCDFETV